MIFSFWLGNHNKMGQRSLEDVIGIIGHQLKALGHEAVWQPDNAQFILGESGYNIIVEGFTDAVVDCIARGYNSGARFICIGSEEPTPLGFNHGTSKEMTDRQECFPRAAPYLDGILSLVPGRHVTDWYSQYAPTAPIELGYAPTLVRKETVREPAFDFGFYGTMSKRRMRLLKKLANATNRPHAIRVMMDFGTQVERDRAMQEAKVIVQIRKHDEMGLVSSSRCNTALCIGRPVVAEPHELAKPWDEVVKFARTDDEFIYMALAMRGAWRGVHSDQFAKFREKFSPEYCIGAPLRAIGVLEQRLAA